MLDFLSKCFSKGIERARSAEGIGKHQILSTLTIHSFNGGKKIAASKMKISDYLENIKCGIPKDICTVHL
jgi:hypothetical protein